MRKEATWSIVIALLALLFSDQDVRAQQWKKIVPLISRCDDVKKLLNVTDCNSPWMKYESAKYDLLIDFSTDLGEWNVSKDTVVGFFVVFHDLVKLSDFETDLTEYTRKRENDVPDIVIYNSAKKGMRLTVQTAVASEPYISSIFVFPSEGNAKKFRRKPPR